jgi:hypothetical protein
MVFLRLDIMPPRGVQQGQGHEAEQLDNVKRVA